MPLRSVPLLLLFTISNLLGSSQAQIGATTQQNANPNRPKSAFLLPSGGQAIQYVVVIMQENRSTDNFFHGLPNADIANSGMNSKGQKITLGAIGLQNDYDPVHEHQDWVAQYDGGKMDGADLVRVACGPHSHGCPLRMRNSST